MEANTEKGEGRRRLWPSTQLMAQGTRARPRPGGGLTSGAPGPHNTLTLGKAPPQGHAHKVSSSCTNCPCHQHPGVSQCGQALPAAPPGPDPQLCRQHLPVQEHRAGGPSHLLGTHRVAAHGSDLTARRCHQCSMWSRCSTSTTQTDMEQTPHMLLERKNRRRRP